MTVGSASHSLPPPCISTLQNNTNIRIKFHLNEAKLSGVHARPGCTS